MKKKCKKRFITIKCSSFTSVTWFGHICCMVKYETVAIEIVLKLQEITKDEGKERQRDRVRGIIKNGDY